MSFVITIRVIATVLPAVAVTMTSLRLYYRWSRRHLGWDDAWAALAIVCAFFETAGAWTRSDTPAVGPLHHGPYVRMIGYYMLQVSFTCMLWTSRMSILFSIIRLIPHMMRMRTWAIVCACLFGAMWITLVIAKIAICESDVAWKQTPGVQCVLGPAIGALELATDFSADIILVSLPMRLLWRIKLSPVRRTLLTGIFSASILTTIVSIVHGVYVFSHNRNAEGIMAHLEASTAMMVCNLAVLVIWLLRVVGHREDSEAHPSDRTPRATNDAPKDLTTLRFQQHSGAIVLHTLDKAAPGATSSIPSIASNESLHTKTFGTGGRKQRPVDVDPEVC